MDSITVVIKMTGLLLLAPTSQGSDTVHVLMPQTVGGMERHVAQVGYLASRCPRPMDHFKICYADMEGWSLDLSGVGEAPVGGRVRSDSARRLRGAVNLTRRMKNRVMPDVLKDRPSGLVHSRVILRAGSVTDSCALGRWSYASKDSASDTVTIALANVLTWTIPNVARNSLPLVRRRLHADPGSAAQIIETVRADATDTLELFIRYVPVSDTLPPWITSPKEPYPDMPADHFRGLYTLLGINGRAPVPVFKERVTEPEGKETVMDSHGKPVLDWDGQPRLQCAWRRQLKQRPFMAGLGTQNKARLALSKKVGVNWLGQRRVRRRGIEGVGTLNCMLASADPP
jgi:hypothetical protein